MSIGELFSACPVASAACWNGNLDFCRAAPHFAISLAEIGDPSACSEFPHHEALDEESWD
jgi:hypothetical protein